MGPQPLPIIDNLPIVGSKKHHVEVSFEKRGPLAKILGMLKMRDFEGSDISKTSDVVLLSCTYNSTWLIILRS
jgi:hypothetical protein